MDQIKLQISNPPLLKGYLNNAYQLALLGEKPEAQTWIFMNYIQLVSGVGNHYHPVTFYNPDHGGNNWGVLTPWFDYSVFTRDFLIENDIDFNRLIVESLFNKQFVHLYINEKYIPNTPAGSINVDFNHQILLYGFNRKTNEVSFLGYDKDRNFSEITIDIEKLKLSYFNNKYDFEHLENRIYLLKVREDEGFKLYFDLEYFIEQLLCFRDGKKVINNVFDYHIDFQYEYGLNVYKNMIQILEQFIQGELQGAYRKLTIPFHVIMEHKHMMIKRLWFVEKKFPNLQLGIFIKGFEELELHYNIIRNMTLKYNRANDVSIIDRIINKMQGLREQEYKLLTNLIDYLSDHV